MAATTFFGIDLGTTYSCIACVKTDGGDPVVLSNNESEQTTPSVVYFESPDNVVVGTPAKEELRAGSQKAIARVKRFMGQNELYEGFLDKPLTPQEVSAYVLRKLAQDAASQVEGGVTDVVITCPAYFGLDAKAATKEAGALAGFNVHYVIPEPVAAAYHYATTHAGLEGKTLLVYDLGGGTFDVTVIVVEDLKIREICVAGDATLGGDDWDSDVALWMGKKLAAECGVPDTEVTRDPETMQTLLRCAETAKRQLSSKEVTAVRILTELGRVRFDFTRAEFDEITQQRLERTLDLTEQVIETAREKPDVGAIDQVLLVGGSTFMPQVERELGVLLQRLNLGHVQTRRADPHLAVAKGAARYAYKCAIDGAVKRRVAQRTGQPVDAVVLDDVATTVRTDAERQVAVERGMQPAEVAQATSECLINVSVKTFGVECYIEAEVLGILNLIFAGTQLPCDATDTVRTRVEGQTGLELKCRESTSAERTAPLDFGTPIGSPVLLRFGKPLPRATPVEVCFQLSADGLLSVRATEPGTGARGTGEFRTGAIADQADFDARKASGMAVTVS